MFEKIRISSKINYLVRCFKDGNIQNFDPTVERLFRPFVPEYARLMRRDKLTTDQATMMLIQRVVEEFHNHGKLDTLRQMDAGVYRSLAAFYVAVDKFVRADFDRFWKGERVINAEVDRLMKSTAPNA